MFWYDDCFDDICINTNKNMNSRSIRRLSKYKNEKIFQLWFRILCNKGLARYKINNLPETCNSRVVSMSILYHAAVCFFEHEGHMMALPGGAGSNGVTVYGDYTYSIVYGRNGWTKPVKLWLKGEDESAFVSMGYEGIEVKNEKPSGVWFRENPQKFRFVEVCEVFAAQIADAWRKMEECMSIMNIPVALSGSEQDYATALKMYQDIKDNVPFMYFAHKPKNEPIGVTELTTRESILKSMEEHIEYLISKFESLCGRPTNANPDKRERLNVQETTAANIPAFMDIQAACDYMNENGFDVINKHFGTNMKIEPNTEMEGIRDEVQRMDKDTGPEQMES